MKTPLRVLVACEFSGIVRDAFRAHGHDAVSCDLRPSERPGPHIQDDVLTVLHHGWDMMLAFPPCTYLCNSGARWWKTRQTEQQAAISFVQALFGAPIHRIALENPEGRLSTAIRPPDQIIQPWQFGEDASKATCLWLKNLPRVRPTRIIDAARMRCRCGAVFSATYGLYGCACLGGFLARPLYANQCPSGQNNVPQSRTRAADRARTYPGIAAAFAAQWPMDVEPGPPLVTGGNCRVAQVRHRQGGQN